MPVRNTLSQFRGNILEFGRILRMVLKLVLYLGLGWLALVGLVVAVVVWVLAWDRLVESCARLGLLEPCLSVRVETI